MDYCVTSASFAVARIRVDVAQPISGVVFGVRILFLGTLDLPTFEAFLTRLLALDTLSSLPLLVFRSGLCFDSLVHLLGRLDQ